MKKTGEMLQNLRIQRGATLAELSSALKINSKVLHALETGNVEQLPKPPFVRGFIKSYVMHFKADPDPFLREYHKEMGLSVVLVQEDEPILASSSPAPSSQIESTKKVEPVKKAETQKPVAPEPEKPLELKKDEPKIGARPSSPGEGKDFSYSDFYAEEKQRDGWRALIFSLVVVILTLVIYVAYRTIDRYQREARISEETERNLGEMAASAVQVPDASMPIPESALPAVINESPEQPLPNNSSNAPTTTATPTAESIPAKAPTNPVTESAPAQREAAVPKEEVPKPTEPSPAEATASTESEASKPPQKVREVVLEALEDVVVDYDAGGKKGTLRLKKDQVHVLRFSKSTSLKINDAGSVNISVDGTDRGVPGEKGNSVVVRY